MRLIAGSFCLSSIIWIFNYLNKDIVCPYNVPLRIKYNETAFIPLKVPPAKVKIAIEGHGWSVLTATYLHKRKPLLIWFKHPGLHSKLDTSVLRSYLESHLGNIKVKQIMLDSITIPFDTKVHKWVHMKLDEKSISMTKGYELDKNILFNPDSVFITGPKTLVSAIADTLKINVPYQGLDKNFNESFKLSYFLHNSNLKLSHEKVNVQFKVRKKQTSYDRK